MCKLVCLAILCLHKLAKPDLGTSVRQKLVQLECCIYEFYTVYACLLCENVCVLLQQILCVCPKWLARSWPQSPDLYSNLNRSLLQLTFLLNINYSPRQSRIKMVIS